MPIPGHGSKKTVMNTNIPEYTPPQPLPPPMLGAELDTFTHKSVVVRLPTVLLRSLKENDFPPEITACLESLRAEIPDARLRPLRKNNAPDAASWTEMIAPLLDRDQLGPDWLHTPWLFVEHYFYRRMMEAIGFFEPGPWEKYDPFAYQKEMSLKETLHSIQAFSLLLEEMIADHGQPLDEALAQMVRINLWGNQGDLSLWPAGTKRTATGLADLTREQYLLVDNTAQVVSYLLGLNCPARRIDFILDNAGLELVFDLGFANFLLSRGIIDQVVFHAKVHPTFVSDTMLKDISFTLRFLASQPDAAVAGFAMRVEDHLSSQRLMLKDHFYWNSPRFWWEMPDDLAKDLMDSCLVISKGDAHYRRLQGDRHWPFETPFATVMQYMRTPLLVQRVIKSEMMLELSPARQEELDRLDPDWQIDGHWGVMHFYQPL